MGRHTSSHMTATQPNKELAMLASFKLQDRHPGAADHESMGSLQGLSAYDLNSPFD